MQKLELLAPAGGPKPFWAAVAAGADAIYCGLGNDFNARRSADNFSDQSFKEACEYAHLAGVRVYVTCNIVIKSHEMLDALALIYKAHQLGADAFIIQDWGLFDVVRHLWPELECHISTQANIHDRRGVEFAYRRGAQRVTLSRELSLPEIEEISQAGCELEVFSHGALCICYSGLCLLSSLSGDRSANRGQCAQPCRMVYELVDDKGKVWNAKGNQRLLCPRDCATIDYIQELTQAGAASLKIEGRMKAPEYVWSVISAYRDVIDQVEAGKTPDLDGARQLVSRAFNRGFTHEYLDGASDNAMMSYERSNNRGQLVGSVVSSRKLPSLKVKRGGQNGGRDRQRTLTQAEVGVVVDQPVGKGDLLEVRPLDAPEEFLVGAALGTAAAGSEVTMICSRPMPEGSVVRLIRSQSALDQVEAAASKPYPRLRSVNVDIYAHLGEPLRVALTCVDGCAQAKATGPCLETARTRAVSAQDLVEHVCRMGQTPFVPCEVKVDLEGEIGIGFSQVHKVRQLAVEQLMDRLCSQKVELEPSPKRFGELKQLMGLEGKRDASGQKCQPSLACLCDTKEQVTAALAAGCDQVFVNSQLYLSGNWPDSVGVWLEEVSRSEDLKVQDQAAHQAPQVCVSTISQVSLMDQLGRPFQTSHHLPVHNPYAARFLHEVGAQVLWLSGELTLREIEQVIAKAPAGCQFGLTIWGNPQVMTTEHCILQASGGCIHDCERCKLRKKTMFLKDRKGNLLPVRTLENGRSQLFLADCLDLVPDLPDLISVCVSRFLMDGRLAEPQRLAQEIKRVRQALVTAREGGRMPGRESGATVCHLYTGIG